MSLSPDKRNSHDHNSEKAPSPSSAKQLVRLRPWIIALPIIAVVAMVVIPVDKSSKRSKVSLVRNDMRSISIAIEAYFVDNNDYPPCARGDLGVNAFLKPRARERNIWTFRITKGEGDAFSLTSPVAFRPEIPPDLFAKYNGCFYGYYATDKGWIIWSCGPDSVYDIDPEKDYDANTTNPLPSLIMKTYDPTNGNFSRGDLWRMK